MNDFVSLVAGLAWMPCLLGISLLQLSRGGASGPAALWSRLGARPALAARVHGLLHWRTRIGTALVGACLIAAFARPRPPWDAQAVGHALWVALTLMFSGAALRIAALGVIKKRAVLADTGVYSLCRHPLYLGTILIVFGACALFPGIAFSCLALAYFLAFYPLMIAKEEFQNAARFGRDFDAYRASTPLVLPLGRWRPAESFDWRRAFREGGAGALACVALACTAAGVLLRCSAG